MPKLSRLLPAALSQHLPACAVLAVLFACSVPGLHAELPAELKERKDAVEKVIAHEDENLQALYKHLHSHPELSYQEEKSALRMAKELRELGFEVTENVGGHGVVGILRNGKGPTVLVRTDMDALPVIEPQAFPTPARSGCATSRATRWGRCTPAAMTCT